MINNSNTLVFNVSEHRNDFPGCDYNAFAAALEDEGAEVAGLETANGVEMYIDNMTREEVEQLADSCGIMDILEYITGGDVDVNESVEGDILEECDSEDCTELEECNEDAPYFDEFNEDMDFDMFDDLDDYSDDSDFDDMVDIDDTVEPLYPSYEEISGIEDLESEEYETEDNIEDDTDEELIDGDELGYESDLTDEYFDIDEAFKAKTAKRRLNEKKKGCCPPARSRRLNETVIAKDELIQRIQYTIKNNKIPCVQIRNKYDELKLVDALVSLSLNVIEVPAKAMDCEDFADYINLVNTLKPMRNTPYATLWRGKGDEVTTILYIKSIERIPLKSKNALLALVDQHQFEYGDPVNGEELMTLPDDVAIVCSYTDEALLDEEELAFLDRFHFIDRLDESRKSNKSNLISLTEALKSFDDKDQKKLDKIKLSVDDVLKAVKGQTIGEKEARDAFAKLKKEQNAIKKIKKNEKENFSLKDIPGVTKAIKAMIAADPEKAEEMKKFRDSLTESVVTALANKKKSLHENAIIAGKKFGTISYKEMCSIYKNVCNKKAALVEKLKNIDDVQSEEGLALKESIAKKLKTLTYLSEELTYRQVAANVFSKLNEDEDTENSDETKKSDEPSMDDLAAMFGSAEATGSEADADDTKDEDTEGKEDEETEEVELARIVIEMASKEDAEQLMELCKDAGIPEDAMEIETGDEESDDTEDSDETDDTEETEGADTEGSEETDDTQNESIRYKNLQRLFEAEDEEGADTEGAEETDDDTEDTADADEDAEDTTEDKGAVKFVLTNSDYVNELAGVLADEYGISEEEFEGMIGGEIVESDDDDTDDTEEKTDSDEDTEEDDIDASDIFGNM